MSGDSCGWARPGEPDAQPEGETSRAARRVVVSLTTIPSRLARIGALLQVLHSLHAQQPRPPELVVLHVPRVYERWPNASVGVPKELLALPWLHVHRPDVDEGPATKLLGLLHASPSSFATAASDTGGEREGGEEEVEQTVTRLVEAEAVEQAATPLVSADDIVVVTDDDSLKSASWLAPLVAAVDAQPSEVAAYLAHELLPSSPDGGIVMGWLGFAFRAGSLNLTDLRHFKWLQSDSCRLADDHMLTGYLHFRSIRVHTLHVASPEGQLLTSLPELSGLDTLVHMREPEMSRAVVSLRCRMRIWTTTMTHFPYWCCWSCCVPQVMQVYEAFLERMRAVRGEEELQRRRGLCFEGYHEPNHIAQCIQHLVWSQT